MAYTLGFIFADGNISLNKRGSAYFSLYSADEDILIFIRRSMGSNHKISKRNERSGNVFRIQVGSIEMVKDLFVLGLITLKSKRMNLPNIPNKYLANFILGYFDGDGSVWVGKIHKERLKETLTIQCSFTSASLLFLKALHLKLKRLGVKRGAIHKIKDKDCSRLVLSVKDSLQIYKIMYNKGQVPFCLKRKKNVFDEYIKIISGRSSAG
ncbi:MAG TPA: LAGLIDADG family homing endonuclease [Candidatus Paceibacterota bacterium]|mgnify:CR=1 FL=1|nr:LAGLIDADG family homing endonuclease [Candidatus Paceibacterota bacterium]